MQRTGQPHGGAASSGLLTPLLAADSRAVSGTFKTDLPKGAFAAHHHASAYQQHALLRCSELGRKQGGLTMAWQSWRERTRTRCQDVICLPGLVSATPWGLAPHTAGLAQAPGSTNPPFPARRDQGQAQKH